MEPEASATFIPHLMPSIVLHLRNDMAVDKLSSPCLLDRVLSHMNPIQGLQLFFKIHFNNILPTIVIFRVISFYYKFPLRQYTHFSYILLAEFSPICLWFQRKNIIWQNYISRSTEKYGV
jgi:hypothetical protein